MYKYTPLALSFGAIIAMLLISRLVFERLNLYEELFWLDIPMHALGGVLIAWFLLSLAKAVNVEVSLWHLLALFMVIAGMWELHEFFVRGVVERSLYGLVDTIKDFVIGGYGLYFGYVFSQEQV